MRSFPLASLTLIGLLSLSACGGAAAQSKAAAGTPEAAPKAAAPETPPVESLPSEVVAVEEVAKGAQVDAPAPPFTLLDPSGVELKLADFKGKYVVLEWINFDCPFVVAQYGSGNMPARQAAAAKDDVVWLSICSSAPGNQGFFEGTDLIQRMIKEKWAGTAYLSDPTGVVGKNYGAKTTPHMYVINPEQVLIYAGAIDDTATTEAADVPNSANYVVAALTAAKAGTPVDPNSTKSYGCGVKYAEV